MAAPTCPLLGDGITDDTLLHIARFLPTAKDLLRLHLTNRRFSTKCIAASQRPAEGVGQRQRQRRRGCRWRRRRRGGGWRGAASRSAGGCPTASTSSGYG